MNMNISSFFARLGNLAERAVGLSAAEVAVATSPVSRERELAEIGREAEERQRRSSGRGRRRRLRNGGWREIPLDNLRALKARRPTEGRSH
jgi:hypothetical protein